MMPELPEVETICTWLREGKGSQPGILGARILRAELFWEGTLVTPAPQEFFQRIENRSIDGIDRRGKYAVFQLDKGWLLFHLRMSGDLVLSSQSAPFAPHDRLALYLENGQRLCFNDARKFGRVWMLDHPDQVLSSLGPEPFDDDFTAEKFSKILGARKRQIKPLLMDQRFLAGLGNIYTDEALHRAKLHPLMKSDQLTGKQVEMLWSSIRAVLSEGIRRSGASIDWVYRGGDFQNYFRVYRRTGEPCLECGAPVQRLVVGQRGTHICPGCQVL